LHADGHGKSYCLKCGTMSSGDQRINEQILIEMRALRADIRSSELVIVSALAWLCVLVSVAAYFPSSELARAVMGLMLFFACVVAILATIRHAFTRPGPDTTPEPPPIGRPIGERLGRWLREIVRRS
jgi:hypothetical protein